MLLRQPLFLSNLMCQNAHSYQIGLLIKDAIHLFQGCIQFKGDYHTEI
jgi:hypothetical protein